MSIYSYNKAVFLLWFITLECVSLFVMFPLPPGRSITAGIGQGSVAGWNTVKKTTNSVPIPKVRRCLMVICICVICNVMLCCYGDLWRVSGWWCVMNNRSCQVICVLSQAKAPAGTSGFANAFGAGSDSDWAFCVVFVALDVACVTLENTTLNFFTVQQAIFWIWTPQFFSQLLEHR